MNCIDSCYGLSGLPATEAYTESSYYVGGDGGGGGGGGCGGGGGSSPGISSARISSLLKTQYIIDDLSFPDMYKVQFYSNYILLSRKDFCIKLQVRQMKRPFSCKYIYTHLIEFSSSCLNDKIYVSKSGSVIIFLSGCG